MNRKSNPWVALVALILLLAVIVCTCTGCIDTEGAAETSPDRFAVEYVDLDEFDRVRIITDTETGVQYLLVYSNRGLGITPLLPAPVGEVDE